MLLVVKFLFIPSFVLVVFVFVFVLVCEALF